MLRRQSIASSHTQVALKRLASMDREARFIQDLEGGMGMDGVDMDDAVSAVSGTSASNSALSAGKLSALSGLSKSSAAKSAMEVRADPSRLIPALLLCAEIRCNFPQGRRHAAGSVVVEHTTASSY
jgi:hypothetical protein